MPDLKFQEINGGVTTQPSGPDLFPYVHDPFGSPTDEITTFLDTFQNGSLDWKTTGKQAFGNDAALGTADGREKFFDLENTTTNFSLPGIDNYSCGKFVHTLDPSIDLGAVFKATSSFLFQSDVPETNAENFYYGETVRIDTNLYGSGNYGTPVSLSTQSNVFGSGTIDFSIGAYHYSYKGFESTCTIVENVALQIAGFNNSNTKGQITTNKGVEITAPNFWQTFGFPLGTIVNNYGLYIADQEYTGSTLIRAIYSEGGAVEFDAKTGKSAILYMSGDDISQPYTLLPANSYLRISPYLPTGGGALIIAATDGDSNPLKISGVFGTTNPTDSTAGIILNASKANGSGGVTTLADGETILQISNDTSIKFNMLGNGNVGMSGNLTLGSFTSGATAANGVLGLSNAATAPTASVDLVQLYGVDLSAGNATLGLRTETAVAVDVSLVSTNSITVQINGSNYKIPLTAV